MKNYFILLFLLTSLVACKKTEPSYFTPGELWADNNGTHINAHGGGILYENGTYYWFGEHKTEGDNGNVANVGVHVYSSTDLHNWKDEGIALAVMPDGSGSDIERGCILERPKVIHNKKTGKYVMWFHLEPKGKGYSGALSGVAISDKVTGPYEFIEAIRPNPGVYPLNYSKEKIEELSQAEDYKDSSLEFFNRDFEDGQMARDMTLFVDEDGKAYHIFASEENRTLHIGLLNDEYTAHTGEYTRNFVDRSMEAPAIFKKDRKYYLMMSGCIGWSPNQARSAVAESILGEWTELGNPCINDSTKTTFHSQSTYILPIEGKKDQFIYLGDRWTPENAIDGRYIWLPIQFKDDRFFIEWTNSWSMEDLAQ